MYARAREEQAETLAAQITDLADEEPPTLANGGYDSAAVNRQRLRIDARKWIASKLKPKVYGDSVRQEHTGPNGGAITVITGVAEPDAKKQDSTAPSVGF